MLKYVSIYLVVSPAMNRDVGAGCVKKYLETYTCPRKPRGSSPGPGRISSWSSWYQNVDRKGTPLHRLVLYIIPSHSLHQNTMLYQSGGQVGRKGECPDDLHVDLMWKFLFGREVAEEEMYE